MSDTAESVARWMLEQLQSQRGYLTQEQAAYDVVRRFGERFTYINQSGNNAIGRDVLDAFRKLTRSTVVWSKSERAWRLREKGDPLSRQVE